MKNNPMHFTGYFIFIFLIPYLSHSQTMNRPPDRMKMLSAFNGEWKGEIAEVKNKKKVRTKISHISEKVAEGWAVQIAETANLPGKGKYMSVKIFSYSGTGDTTYMYVVDNQGATYFYQGTWKGNKRLELNCNVTNDNGKMAKKEVTYDFKNMREYEYKYISTIADSVESVIEMSMKKQ
jgi:hypothetical protein